MTANGEWTSALLICSRQDSLGFVYLVMHTCLPPPSNPEETSGLLSWPGGAPGPRCPQMLLGTMRLRGRQGWKEDPHPDGSQSQCPPLCMIDPPPPNSSTESRATPTPMLWPQRRAHGAARLLLGPWRGATEDGNQRTGAVEGTGERKERRSRAADHRSAAQLLCCRFQNNCVKAHSAHTHTAPVLFKIKASP